MTVRKIIFGLIIIFSSTLILYLFNEEKFYPEYWLQRNIDNYSCIEPMENIDLAGTELTYKFYHDSGIDIEISLSSNGIVSIGRHKWFNDMPDSKTYSFKFDKRTVEQLIDEFSTIYCESEINEADFKFGGEYSILIFDDNIAKDRIEIGYYNVVPKNQFKEFKSKIIEIGNEVISEINR